MTESNPSASPDQWFYAKGGQQTGPVTFDALRHLASLQQIWPDDLVWAPHLPQWVVASSVEGLFAPPQFAPAPSPYAPVPSPYNPTSGGPMPVSPLGYESINTFAPEYAGFWIRFVAAFLDGILLRICQFAVLLPIRLLAGLPMFDNNAPGAAPATVAIVLLFEFLFQTATGWLYEAYMTSGPKQATFGKMAVGIVVVDYNGNRLTFGRATGRHFAKIVSAITLCVGFLMVAFTEKKQGLHDMIASTLVVKGKRG